MGQPESPVSLYISVTSDGRTYERFQEVPYDKERALFPEPVVIQATLHLMAMKVVDEMRNENGTSDPKG